ncbi:type II toxin-antitoxin system VapC family toxin [Microbacterium album]|uniref:Ribonuclease VapC n=1 Tax=Microbacterium album TaxID=2053191 RepID=A0A917ICZ0_9MICO|nr:type II toxin-antitoxin system VapC family toxin [Microbacterium album]GGH35979.1 ribonuclease VapC35 [Microbacterium album]
MVTSAYLDTSAAMKLIVLEDETSALRTWWGGTEATIASSWLLHTELHCAAGRRPELVTPTSIAAILGAVTLIDITRGDLLAAGTHAPLRSNDAIHLATALRIGADELITYDSELAGAARAAGLRVSSPR